MQILGVPEEDEPRMLMLTQQMFGGQDEDLNQSPIKNLPPEQIIQIVAGAVKNFEDYFAGLAAERRKNPVDDLAIHRCARQCPEEGAAASRFALRIQGLRRHRGATPLPGQSIWQPPGAEVTV